MHKIFFLREIFFYEYKAVGSSGYYIILVNLTSSATVNNTIKVNGATSPVVFGFTTSPNVANNQTDAAGTRTIKTSVAKTANENVITYAAPKAINAVAEKEGISVYPNPVSANRQVTLKLQSAG